MSKLNERLMYLYLRGRIEVQDLLRRAREREEGQGSVAYILILAFVIVLVGIIYAIMREAQNRGEGALQDIQGLPNP
ncbi:MAG TPA: hypothetical protein EYH30_06690 [Anaerolineales bacterium]|nr:hypothetical protein [Anaerolineae bacterium]HIQ01800.1 hypothetical protein [Anaerolineales bacterium]